MIRLHMGVLDVAYSDKMAKGATTTGQVAEILEEKYHVMRIFYEEKQGNIAQDFAEVMAGEIESLMQGRPPVQGFLNGVGPKIEKRFRNFLDANEIQRIFPHTQQIQAAKAGVSHRRKHPNAKKNPSRPAFVDTGLYQASFKAWVNNEH